METKRRKTGPVRMRELGMKRITIYVGPTTHAGLMRIAKVRGVKLAAFVRGCAIYFERGGAEISRLAVAQLKG